ncbi:MAG: DinB family protein [Pirellulales bacterium]
MPTAVDHFTKSYEFNRGRTLDLLINVEKLPNPQAALAWRPGPERAHIGWQLMHIAVTEDVFASERLAQKPGKFADLWPRFRGGSTPDEDVPTGETIRRVLSESRAQLLATLAEYDDSRLEEIPEALKQRNWTVRTVLSVIGWHEAHHQGQAHITLNLFKAADQG